MTDASVHPPHVDGPQGWEVCQAMSLSPSPPSGDARVKSVRTTAENKALGGGGGQQTHKPSRFLQDSSHTFPCLYRFYCGCNTEGTVACKNEDRKE